jgi:chromatin segregation and condensation protein Rec8/ScpA/Scc1 (kleisin family)
VISEPDRIRETLVQQLVAHRRQAAEALDRQKTVEERRFSRAETGAVEKEPGQAAEPSIVSVWDLVQQARGLAGWVVKHREERRQRQEFHVELDDVTVSEMCDYLRSQIPLWHDSGIEGTKLLSDEPSPSRRACLFLGMLELAQQQVLEVQQNESFGEFLLRRR